MLLPSALHCDARPRQRPYANQTYLTPTPLFPSTPPPSDERIPSGGNGLLGTCRALQSLLNSSPAPSPRRAKPQPLQSPVQFRRSSPKPSKVSRVTPQTPRGANKRRRSTNEDQGYTKAYDAPSLEEGFVTPKRRRRCPETLPLGLESSDFESLDPTPRPGNTSQSGVPWIKVRDRRRDEDNTTNYYNPAVSFNPAFLPPTTSNDAHIHNTPYHNTASNTPPARDDPTDWTADDDERLIALVLEKLKLTRHDWDECAQLMGKDQDSVGRRWKALVGEGNIGLRRGTGRVRGRIHDIWRQ